MLGKVEGSFLTDEMRDEFAVYVNKTLKPAMDQVGFKTSDSDSERIQMIRPRLINWLADHGRNSDALAFAKEQFEKFMDSPDSVDPSIIAVSVYLACIDGDMELYRKCRERFENATIPATRQLYLSALGSFENTGIQDTALVYALEGPLRPQEFFSIPGSIAGNSSERADFIFTWLTNNFEKVLKIIPPQYQSYLPFFAGGCSSERIAAAKLFFDKEENQVQGTVSQMAKVTEQVQDCITLRDRERENVETYLKEYVGQQK